MVIHLLSSHITHLIHHISHLTSHCATHHHTCHHSSRVHSPTVAHIHRSHLAKTIGCCLTNLSLLLKSMGASQRTIERIFITNGVLISLIGAVSGLAIGIIATLLQQKYGFIKLGTEGSFLVDAYPVIIKGSDIAITSICVAVIGYLIAILPARTTDPRWEE